MGNKVHHGKNIKRLREILGIKQEALALEMGEDWNQRKVSLLEQKDDIDEPTLQTVANALKLPIDAIKNYDDEAPISIISSTFQDNSSVNNNSVLNFNPIDKWVEALEENKKLYERLLESEREKIEILKKALEDKRL
jgi:transcriptional regulator with XRE-family HTH domain